MSLQGAFIGMCVVASLCMVGLLIVSVAEELRHRRNERDVSIDALVAAFRIHEVAASARAAMTDEVVGMAETNE